MRRSASAVAALLILATLAGCSVTEASQPSAKTVGAPLAPRADVQAPESTQLAVEQVIPADPVAIEIDAIGLSSPIVTFDYVDGEFDPGPDQTLPVWFRGYGTGVGGSNATYIGGHSSRLEAGMRDTVFNQLFDRESQQSRVAVGDIVRVTTSAGQRVCYDVVFIDVVNKEWLSSAEAAGHPAWLVYGSTLVILTCAQERTNTPSINELVIVTGRGYVC